MHDRCSVLSVVPQKQPDFSVTIDVKHRRPQESFDETKNGLIET
jgi:hypothetical protein